MTTYPARTRRWTREEYGRLIEIGVFRPGEPVELLGGELVVSEPQGSAHYTAIGLVEDVLRAALGPGWLVRSQGPIALDDESEPEPDIAVTRGGRRDYSRAHPAQPALVVEVAESSLPLDREHKGSLYARARLDDYWILNLIDRALEVYRRAVQDPSAHFGWRYASREVLGPESSIAPLVAPHAQIVVRDLLRSTGASMKITHVTTRVLRTPADNPLVVGLPVPTDTREFVTLELGTDQGLVGVGLTFFGGALTAALKVAVDTLVGLIVGDDPTQTEAIAANEPDE